SDNSDVKASVNMFLSHDGAAKIVKQWGKRLVRTSNDVHFVEVITDILVSRVHTELNRLAQDESLRYPASRITQSAISSFSLEYINDRLCEAAPFLKRTLEGVSSANPRAIDDIPAFVSTMGAMILFLKSQQSNYLQMTIGVYLYSQGCSKSLVSVLSKIGLSVSQMTIHNALRTLTSDTVSQARVAILNHPWILLYDNINIANR
ncbi:hypothetical protein BGZ65_012118, partial [Modicella reniformis]